MSKSKKNKLAGTSTGTSISAKFFKNNPDSKDKKNAYNKDYHKTKERKDYRVELNKKNRQDKGYGDGMDLSHTKDGKLVKEARSTNRARNGRGNTPKKK